MKRSTFDRVMRRLEEGMTEEEIEMHVKASSKTISKCKREFDIRNKIKALMSQGKFDEAQVLADELGKKIFTKKTLFILLELARKRGDISRIKELIEALKYKKLNYEEKKQALYVSLEVEPDNLESINMLIRMARKQKDDKTVAELLNKKHNLGREEANENRKRKRHFEDITISEFESLSTRINPIQRAREIIYQSEYTDSTVEEISELLKEEDETNRVLVMAELFAHVKLTKKAESLLKDHKKSLDPNSQKEEIKTINKALDFARNPKTPTFRWRGIWLEGQNKEYLEVNSADENDLEI